MAETVGPHRAILLDIEGTTTSIRFVYEVLFPYARRELGPWLRRHHGGQAQEILDLLLADAATQAEAPPALRLRLASGPEEITAHCLWQMDQDRKSTALKALQGLVWRAGYEDGELKADVFDDVPGALRAWHAASVTVSIYSSGSVAAQKLLFGHTHHGDLRPLLRAYFDTLTGPKREASSYLAIAQALDLPPHDLLFATDILAEAQAAREAGLQAVLMDRPGNHPQPPHDFPVLASFTPLLAGL